MNPRGEDSFSHWCFLDDTQHSMFVESLRAPASARKAVEFYKKNRVVVDSSANDEKLTGQARKWSIERDQAGAFNTLLDSNDQLVANFVTSKSLAEKIQCIDLAEEGYDEKWMLNRHRLFIEVSERYTARDEISCFYNLAVFLLTKDFRLVDSFKHLDHLNKWPCEWRLVSKRFDVSEQADAKRLVRYVVFYHSGRVCF